MTTSYWKTVERTSPDVNVTLGLGDGMFNDFVELMGAPEMDALGKKYTG